MPLWQAEGLIYESKLLSVKVSFDSTNPTQLGSFHTAWSPFLNRLVRVQLARAKDT